MMSQFTQCRCLHSHWCLPVTPGPMPLKKYARSSLEIRHSGYMQIIRIMLWDLAGTLA